MKIHSTTTHVYRISAAVLLLGAIISCASPPPTTHSSLPSPSLSNVPILLTEKPIRSGFKIKNTPDSYPLPSCADPVGNPPIEFDVQYKNYFINNSGQQPADPQYASFQDYTLHFTRNQQNEIVIDASFVTLDGPTAYRLDISPTLTGKNSYQQDFEVTVPSANMHFGVNWGYGSNNYQGGNATAKITYTAQNQTLTIELTGSEDIITDPWIHGGQATFQGKASFNLIFPKEKFDLEVTEPFVDGEKSAAFHVTPAYCSQNEPWTLQIDGLSDTPDSSGSKNCSWTHKGTQEVSDLRWDGKCDDGRMMKSDTYEAVLSMDNQPSPFTDREGVGILTSLPTPTPTPTVTPTPTACPPGDPSCPLICPICPPPSPTSSPTSSPSVSPSPSPSPTPTVTSSPTPSPTPTPTPTATPTVTPTPTATPSDNTENCQGTPDLNSIYDSVSFCKENQLDSPDDQNSNSVNNSSNFSIKSNVLGIDIVPTIERYYIWGGGIHGNPLKLGILVRNSTKNKAKVEYSIYEKTTKGMHLLRNLLKTSVSPTGPIYTPIPLTWDGKDDKGVELQPGVYYTATKNGIAERWSKIIVNCRGFYDKYPKYVTLFRAQHIYNRHAPLYVNDDLRKLLNDFVTSFYSSSPMNKNTFISKLNTIIFTNPYPNLNNALLNDKGKGTLFPENWSNLEIVQNSYSLANFGGELDQCVDPGDAPPSWTQQSASRNYMIIGERKSTKMVAISSLNAAEMITSYLPGALYPNQDPYVFYTREDILMKLIGRNIAHP